MAHLDQILKERGGLRPFLKECAKQKRHQSITTAEFQEMVEDYHGPSLQGLFNKYIYAQESTC